MLEILKRFVKKILKGKTMNRPKDRKELEEILRRAFEIDRTLPNAIPSPPSSLIGKMIVIPDTERSLEDINEDMKHNRSLLTAEDIELWENVNEWLKGIEEVNRFVVIKRCQGFGWKKIGILLAKKNLTMRVMERTTLWRYFKEGLDEILSKIK